jgi:hypothetical protein
MDCGKDTILKAWYCAAIFHDISYSVANVEEWVGFFLDRVILQPEGPDKQERNLKEQWVLNQIARLFRFENYQDSFTRLVDTMAQFSNITDDQIKSRKLSNQVYTMLLGRNTEKIPVKSDHGVLSALMLLNAFERKCLDVGDKRPMNNFILLAADAIAHHNKPDSIAQPVMKPRDWSDLYKGGAKENANVNPLRDLLIISDQIQQWGRTESEASEAYIDIVLSEWRWTCGSGTDDLNIVLKYKAPIDDARRDKEKANDFYENTWRENVAPDIRSWMSCFLAPWGNILLRHEFDQAYFNAVQSQPDPFAFRHR